ncbi:MAG: SRPBCC domain-containing protein [Longimicrobiaceae bacterium]
MPGLARSTCRTGCSALQAGRCPSARSIFARGGAWHHVWRRTDGTEMEMRGEYRTVAAPERLISTESWGGEWPDTLNTLILTEENGRTTLVQTILYPSKEARDAVLQTGMKQGVSLSFDRLADYLAKL